MFTIPRNRNATIAAGIVMFGQQFCGVNVIGTSFFRLGGDIAYIIPEQSLLFVHCVRRSWFLSSIGTVIIIRLRFD